MNFGFLLQNRGDGLNYLQWLLHAWGWTLILAVTACLLALVIGVAVGVARTWPNRGLLLFSQIWIGTFRNIPVLVQIFLWYHVVPQFFPAMKSWPAAVLVIFGLSIYTSARVAVQVSAGIQAIPLGQIAAGSALGLSTLQIYRRVLLPVAMRTIVPPLTSEAMACFKNTSVAFAVGIGELTFFAIQAQEETARGVEVYLLVTVLYVASAMCVNRLMAWLERRVHLPGAQGMNVGVVP
jgi:glutamate/aspartate transport system permease protein